MNRNKYDRIVIKYYFIKKKMNYDDNRTNDAQ